MGGGIKRKIILFRGVEPFQEGWTSLIFLSSGVKPPPDHTALDRLSILSDKIYHFTWTPNIACEKLYGGGGNNFYFNKGSMYFSLICPVSTSI